MVTNLGTHAHIEFGDSSVTATTSSMALLPGAVRIFTIPDTAPNTPATYMAAITPTGSAVLQVSTGEGV